MPSSKRASFYLFTTALALVPAAAITACGDDDTGTPPVTTLLDGSASDRPKSDGQVTPTDSGKTDAPITPADSGNDANSPENEAGADAGPDADAGHDAGHDADADAGHDADADAATAPTVDDATYKITAWTCTNGGGSTDVLAFAATMPTPGIGEIDLTVGGTSKVASLYSGGDCVRSNAVTVGYPEAGKITTTTTATTTCAGTCTAAQCDEATPNPVIADTFSFTKTSTSFTATRTFPSGANATLAGVAGCVAGDAESVTYTKK